MNPTLEKPAAYRQSLIASFDSCPLRARFSLEDDRRTPSPIAARGTLLHRAMHEAVRLMQANGERRFSPEQGMELLTAVLAQMGPEVDSGEVVPIPMREMRWARVMMIKWCEYVELDPSKIIAIEERYTVPIDLPTGKTVDVTGQMDLLLADPPNGIIVVDYKAQPWNAKVLTPHGWRSIGALCVGDEVIGSDGKPTEVIGRYPQGSKEVFEVEFTDGSKTRCCNEHLWKVWSSGNKKWYVRSLAELRNNKSLKGWQVPAVQPVQFEKKDLPIEPYLLGLLLGDGHFKMNGSVGFCTADAELVENVQERIPVGVSVVPDKWDKRGYDHTISAPKGYANLLRYRLGGLGLLGKRSWEKFVPEEYLYGSVEQRLELLCGLMDSDGHISQQNQIGFRSTSKQLAEGVAFLVRSLGGRASLLQFKPTPYRPSYSVQFRIPMVPFRLRRKAERWKPNKLTMNRGIRAVRSVGVDECICIKVAAEDGLYVTDDLIVTHNTGYRRPKTPRTGGDPIREARAEDEGSGLTELGWVQNLVYSYLALKRIPWLEYVIFREVHVLRQEERQAKTTRWKMEQLQDVLAAQVALLDQAIEEGPASERWTPSGGPHCALCPRPWACPIMDMEQINLHTAEGRRRVAHEWIVAGRIRSEREDYLKGIADAYGPIEVVHSDGRRVVGWDMEKKRFGLHEPYDIPDSPWDQALEDAARGAGVLAE